MFESRLQLTLKFFILAEVFVVSASSALSLSATAAGGADSFDYSQPGRLLCYRTVQDNLWTNIIALLFSYRPNKLINSQTARRFSF